MVGGAVRMTHNEGAASRGPQCMLRSVAACASARVRTPGYTMREAGDGGGPAVRTGEMARQHENVRGTVKIHGVQSHEMSTRERSSVTVETGLSEARAVE